MDKEETAHIPEWCEMTGVNHRRGRGLRQSCFFDFPIISGHLAERSGQQLPKQIPSVLLVKHSKQCAASDPYAEQL